MMTLCYVPSWSRSCYLWQDWWDIKASPRNQKPLSLFPDDLTWAITSTSYLYFFVVVINSMFFSIRTSSFHQFLKLSPHLFLSPAVISSTENNFSVLGQASGFLPSHPLTLQGTKFTTSRAQHFFSLTQTTNTCKLKLFILDWVHVVVVSRKNICPLIKSLWK